jgi:hypothetical protein
MNKMRSRSLMMVSIAATAAIAMGAPGAGASNSTTASSTASSVTSFHGTVTSVSKANKTFRLRRSTGATLTFRVTSTTKYERLAGLASLRGKAVEVKARRIDGRWTARKIEPDDDSADDNGDDGPNHDAGDDHGSGGHGGDD